MKKLLLVPFIIFAFWGCSNSTDPEEPVELPTGYYKFDVKTPFFDKIEEAGSKSGTMSYLKKGGWADIGEINEDYSVWLYNLVRTAKSDGTVTVDFNLELHTPAMWTDGDLIPGCRKHFTIKYNLNEELEDVTKPLTAQSVMKGFQSVIDIVDNSEFSKIPSIKEYTSGAQVVTDLLNLVLSFISSGTEKQHQAEAVYVGAYCYEQMRKWMLAIEKGEIKK